MSKATKRKHVTREVVEDEIELAADHLIVKVLCGRGNNLHEVEGTDGSKFLVSMPSKFRKNVWIKRGDFVVVEPIKEGHKVQGEITRILYPMQVKALKEQGFWPKVFTESCEAASTSEKGTTKTEAELEESFSDEDEDLFRNTNHPPPLELDTDSSSSDYQDDPN